jgi:pimeloyl-ACP methyl ester carboxylesterase
VARIERVVRHPLDLVGSQHRSVARLRKIIRPTDSVFLAVSYAAFGPHASARQIDFTYDMLAETETDVLFDLFKCYRDFEVTDLLGDIAVPVLVVSGTRDRLTVSGASEYLADHLPKAELKLIEGCGHMTMLERHAEFNAMLETFLNDTLGKPKGKAKGGR